LTGAAADHRLPLAAGSVDALTRALARRLGIDAPQAGELPPEAERWLDLVAPDLERHHGAALVVAGDTQPPAVHAVVAAINVRLGSAGHTLAYLAPDTDGPAPEPVEALAAAYDAAAVDTLIVAGCNPAYDTPPDLDLARRLAGTPFVAHLGLYRDETAAAAAWHLPAVHAFEDWSDLRAFDGTASIAQPVIAPLYAGRSLYQFVDALRSGTGRSAATLVKAHWQDAFGEDFDARWQPALQAGVVDGSALADATPKLREDWQRGLPVAAPATRLELVIRPDPTVHDGRYAPNAWLQELPKPLTQLTWDNAALVSPQLAEREGLENGALVELAVDGRNVRAPVWIVPGTSPQSIVVTLGYGRRLADGAEAGGGYDAYRLRASHAPWRRDGVTLAATGARQRLVSTQLHHSMEGRELVRHATLNAYRADPHFAQDAHRGAEQPSMYPPWPRGDCAWGMSIDLNACIGCNACIVACQAENNIPVVGKDEVARGREMHWLRVDRYYAGPLDAPRILFQPVPCMHCELAPCEVVCPVAATLHDSQGLNLQVYNRCVGTRFCSNNCPYKVRRFNFFEYAASEPALVAQRNPEVTVRSRGVMEKCTYCIQRIQGARIEAGKAGRELRDGEVVTACQGACPAQAIVFGNLADADSEVARAKRSPLDYALLGELNTRPRTTYRARVTNPASESGSDGA
ncbi:MAG TPA: 4Fe-4S dicluster domain-containing protein, partial [Pelomicrobium sp.]|nr:4Fe-4S dicluster domain-containing protein [Pelomicrobium sp.]